MDRHEALARLKRGVGRMNLVSLLTVLGGSAAVGAATEHQAGWAWAIGTTAAALGPTIHVLAVWMRSRELRDVRGAEIPALRAEVASLRAQLEAQKPPCVPVPGAPTS